MIKRLSLSHVSVMGYPEWPEDDRDAEGYLFEGRVPFRKIVVMIDTGLVETSVESSPTTQGHLLTDLLQHDFVSAYRYDEAREPTVRPPDGEDSDSGDEVDRHLPWVTVGPRADGIWPVRFMQRPGGFVRAGVWGNAVDVARTDSGADAYGDLDPETAVDRRGADALAAEVASQALHADLYITKRPYLHAPRREIAHETTLCQVDEALTILGLYFRTRANS